MTFLVKINGSEIPKVVKYKVGRNKLWTDADRAMDGSLHATMIGIFPNINMQLGYLTTTEMGVLIGLLDLPSFSVEYWDESISGYTTGTYYAPNYELSVFNKTKELYEPITFDLIPYNKIEEISA